MAEPASAVYEVVLESTSEPRRFLQGAFDFIRGVLAMGRGSASPGGLIISIIHKDTGEELFRHVEDMGDDEDHLLVGIERDLAAMTASEFAARWTS